MNRSVNYLAQVKLSIIFKLVSILLTFVIFSKTIDILGMEMFGVWVILLFFYNAIIMFDFGAGNGLKNLLSLKLSDNNIKYKNTIISTTYVVIAAISIVMLALTLLFFNFVDASVVLNSNALSSADYSVTLLVSFSMLFSSFVFILINQIAAAFQKTSLITLNQVVSQILTLLGLLFFDLIFTFNALVTFSLIYGVSLISSSLIVTFFFFKSNNLSFGLKFFSTDVIAPIFKPGMNFLLLQCLFLLILAIDKFLIVQLLSPVHVSSYEILFKLFGVVLILHELLNAPLWPMYTEAKSKKDYIWIFKSFIKINKLTYLYVIFFLFLVIFRNEILDFWISNKVRFVDVITFILMGVMMIVLVMFKNIAYLSNGLYKTKVQLFSILFGIVIKFPLALFLVEYLNMGIDGVIISTIVALLVFVLFGSIYFYRYLEGKIQCA